MRKKTLSTWSPARLMPPSKARARRDTRPQRIAIDPARLSLAGITTVLLCVLLCIHLWPNRVSLRLGDISSKEILAQRTVRFEDTGATRRAREEAAKQASRYSAVSDATGLALQTLRDTFLMEPTLSMLPETARSRALNLAENLVATAMKKAIRDTPNELPAAREALRKSPELSTISDRSIREVVTSAAANALLPNLRLDNEETRRASLEAQAQVKPIVRRYAAGEAILHPGERVTQQHLDAFAALGLQNASIDALTVVTICVLVVLLVAFVVTYLRLFLPRVYTDTPRLVLLAILTVVSVLGLKVGSTLLGLPVSGGMVGYLAMMCVTSAGMVISSLIRPSLALLVVSLLAAVSGLILNNELRFTLLTLGSAYAGIVAGATLRNRTDLLRALLILCSANALMNGLIGQLEGDLPRELVSGMLWGVISGAFALFLYYCGTAAFEKLFGVTTQLRLLELSDPATPILQELRLKVPGTYAHSLMVGTLAHAAAEAIGADALLARVAAYYHDIGKMNRPEFFIENQSNAENVHDKIAPTLSALILVSHVKDGVEIAERVGIPPLVRELIEQHHGTSLMRYFYFQATGGTSDPALEGQFRYPGPKPRRKEAAILMLADTVEAASRSLEKPTPQRIADFIASLIEDKRADGQLDDSELTLRDLSIVQDVFTRTLTGTLHARIAYPTSASTTKPENGTADNRSPARDVPRPRPGRSLRPPTLGRRRKP
ncbi:MAG: HDIG domain-containing protein [Armatimonas sp.]